MRARPILVSALGAALVVGLAACGGGGGGDAGARSLELRHTEPLRAGAPVRWTLVFRNDTSDPVELTFPSGKDGDVVLRQGGAERYRWSRGRFFTEALRTIKVGGNETRTFVLEGERLEVAAGDYELEATLAGRPGVPAVKRRVTVAG